MTEIIAPIEGKITQVLVKVGDTVMADDELFIIEALKMENPIFASENGVVKEILVKEADKVESEQVLMIIE